MWSELWALPWLLLLWLSETVNPAYSQKLLEAATKAYTSESSVLGFEHAQPQCDV